MPGVGHLGTTALELWESGSVSVQALKNGLIVSCISCLHTKCSVVHSNLSWKRISFCHSFCLKQIKLVSQRNIARENPGKNSLYY